MESNIVTHWRRLNQEYPKEQIFGVFLHGSQNYDERRAVSAIYGMLCANYNDYLKTKSEKKK